MAFLGISLKSAKMGAGRAILSHLNEKREDKLREQERQNRLDDMRTEFEVRDDYAIKAENRAYDREIDRLREANVIKNEQQEAEWRLGTKRAVEMSEKTGRNFGYVGNGNLKLLDDDDDPMAVFLREIEEAKELTRALRESGEIEPNQSVLPKRFNITGQKGKDIKPRYSTPTEGSVGVASINGKKVFAFRGANSPSIVTPRLETPVFSMPNNQIGKIVLNEAKDISKNDKVFGDATLLMNTLMRDIDFHIEEYKKPRDQRSGASLFEMVKERIGAMGPSIKDRLRETKQNQEGFTVYDNPNMSFKLTEYAQQGDKEAQNAELIIRDILAPALSIQASTLVNALGFPEDGTQVYTDDDFNIYIDTAMGARLKDYTESYTDDSGQKKFRLIPEVKNLANEIAMFSGRSYLDVLSHATDSPDPINQMKRVAQIGPSMSKAIGVSPSKTMTLNPTQQEVLYDLIKHSTNPDEAISTIRSMMKEPPPLPPESIRKTDTGIAKPVWARTVGDYGMKPDEAVAQAQSAEKARKTIAVLIELQDMGARGDVIALARMKIAGAVEAFGAVSGLLDDLNKTIDSTPIQGEVGSEEFIRNKEAREQTLNELSELQKNINTSQDGSSIEAEALFRMLSLQLGYYMAGAVQGGGPTGRNISDFDVRNNVNAMQLDSIATKGSKRAILQYLYEEMDQTYAIANSYASSQHDFAKFRATQIYDQMVGGTHESVGSILQKIGLISEEEAEERRQRYLSRSIPARETQQRGKPGVNIFGEDR